ncbi:MAG: cytidine deaminase [Bacilli bacterium]|nr:cytidine deaminase [Bacilli bacterium]
MREKLEELLDNSYSPYSNMKFAAIVESESGDFFEGVNIENASFGGTICAERNAINNAISHGIRKFKALYLMTSSDEICYPCNICKQTFLEFFDKDVIFNIMTKSGKMKVLTFDEIMKTTFSKEDLV